MGLVFILPSVLHQLFSASKIIKWETELPNYQFFLFSYWDQLNEILAVIELDHHPSVLGLTINLAHQLPTSHLYMEELGAGKKNYLLLLFVRGCGTLICGSVINYVVRLGITTSCYGKKTRPIFFWSSRDAMSGAHGMFCLS